MKAIYSKMSIKRESTITCIWQTQRQAGEWESLTVKNQKASGMPQP